MNPPAGPALAVENLEVVYDRVARSLRGVSLDVPDGRIVALLGANGAGKTTVLRAISGLLALRGGRITKGTVQLHGRDVTGHSAPAVVRAGVAQVMEGRRIFSELSVEDNLRAGGYTRRRRAEVRETRDEVLELFPILARHLKRTAGYLSGGEQQMLAIGRALMSRPRVLLLDEPLLGLAPKLVDQVRAALVEVNRRGAAVLLVEQNARMALQIATSGYVMQNGEVVRAGSSDELLGDDEIREFYLGIGARGRRPFAGAKARRSRPRWVT